MTAPPTNDHEMHDRPPVPEVPPLSWTGERFIPGEGGPEIYYEHAHRYLLARNLLAGAVVVDLASGEGYGAGWIAEVAESVIGVDVDPASVAHSKARYGRCGNLDFAVGDIQSLPFASDSVDGVTCFEAIEHVENPRAVVEEVVRILRPGGLLLVSTPNKAVYADQRDYSNEFHVHEFYLPDLELLLSEYFFEQELVGQRLVVGSVTWALGDPPLAGGDDAGTGVLVAPGFRESGDGEPATMVEPMYVLAACRLAGAPRTPGRLPAGSILVDPEELLLDFYRHGDATAGDIDAHAREHEAHLERARAQLAAYEEQATLLRRRIRQLDEQATRPDHLPSASSAESDFLQDSLSAHQALAAQLSADLAAATEVNVRLLSELHAQQSVLADIQLRDPRGDRWDTKLTSGARGLKTRLVYRIPGVRRVRAVARRARCLVPWR